MDVMSSPLIFFRIVVLPALSSPLESNDEVRHFSPNNDTYRNNILISFSFWRLFLMIVSSPMVAIAMLILPAPE